MAIGEPRPWVSALVGSPRRPVQQWQPTPYQQYQQRPMVVAQQCTPGKRVKFLHVVLLLLLCIICFPLGLIAVIIYACTRRGGTAQQMVVITPEQ